MIETLEGLQATKQALVHLENAMRELESERATYHPKTYAVLAEPIEDDIAKFRAEIAAFEATRPAMPSIGVDHSANPVPVGDLS